MAKKKPTVHVPEGMAIPEYETRKRVGALKITDLRIVERERPEGDIEIAVEGAEERLVADGDWCARFQPKVGGWIVFYRDGYISFSPDEPFTDSASATGETFNRP